MQRSPRRIPPASARRNVLVRFSSWMTAVRSLRERAGSDFIPELGETLELSRVRPDSIAMRDVCRVASFYLDEWTGIEPLPGDLALR